jgi:anti-sigma regulatory factor (Ser/Thr protein kinase)
MRFDTDTGQLATARSSNEGDAPVGDRMPTGRAFAHRALFYADDDEFLAGTAPFVWDGLAGEEAVMVAVTASRRSLLEGELGSAAEDVCFVEMEALGGNPARIIPAWRRFVADHALPGRAVRGVGEPIWRGRSAEELDECHRHEALLNLAFLDSPAWQLLCPYDASALDDATLAAACQTHPELRGAEGMCPSPAYLRRGQASDTLAGALPEPPALVAELPFDRHRLALVRREVARHAAEAGLRAPRDSDLVLAVDELASNSVCHGGGEGRLRVWREPGRLVCEVRDQGVIDDPLAGRHEPRLHQPSGRGLWIANQLCDLVQIRSGEHTVVRVHMSL